MLHPEQSTSLHRHPDSACEVAEILGSPICEGQRINARIGGCSFDFLAMLVGTGEELDLVTIEPLEPGQRVAGDRRVGMADMGLVVNVVDRRRQVIIRTHGFIRSAVPPARADDQLIWCLEVPPVWASFKVKRQDMA